MGLFSWKMISPLLKLNQSFRGNHNTQLLVSHLQPFTDLIYSNDDGIDNDVYHHTYIFREWFEEHSVQFQSIIWSFKSLDIEHIWNMIAKPFLYKIQHLPKSQNYERLSKEHC